MRIRVKGFMTSWLSLTVTRLLWLPPTLLVLLVFVFVISRVVPIDPAVLAAGENATAAQVEEVRQRLGLDEPLLLQFAKYLRDVLHGDLGNSVYTQQPVIQDLILRLPATLELAIVAALLASLFSIPLGVVAGLHRNSWLDHAVRLFAAVSLALASFWIAIQLQFLFSMKLGWLPLSGRTDEFAPDTVTGFVLLDAAIAGDGAGIVSALRHIILPAGSVSLLTSATLLRFARNSAISAASSASVAYQEAMGMPRRVIVWKYVLRMALAATVTQLGLSMGVMLTGSLVVEAIFDWPGLGGYAVQSILYSDYNALMGVTLCVGALFAVFNLLVDLLQAAIDPRGES